MDDKMFKDKLRKIKQKRANIAKAGARKKKPDYNAQYRATEWLELRERILRRDNHRCVSCYATPKTLHVHHLLYQKGRRIWEVPDFYLVSLCPRCHKKEHSRTFIIPTRHFNRKKPS